MANIDDSSAPPAPFASPGDKWLLLAATLVYAAGVSTYVALSTTSAMRDIGSAIVPGGPFDFLYAGFTLFWILGSAIGFMLLAGLLDILTERRPQPLSALNIALAGFATFELLKVPLLMIALHIWYSLT